MKIYFEPVGNAKSNRSKKVKIQKRVISAYMKTKMMVNSQKRFVLLLLNNLFLYKHDKFFFYNIIYFRKNSKSFRFCGL